MVKPGRTAAGGYAPRGSWYTALALEQLFNGMI
jgi:hypothetical protein